MAQLLCGLHFAWGTDKQATCAVEFLRPHRDLVGKFPGNVLETEIMEGTADLHHGITNMISTEANILLEDTTALHGTDDVLNPNATLRDRTIVSFLYLG